MFEWLPDLADSFFQWFVVGILFKYLFMRWVAGKTGDFLKFLFLRTQRDIVYYIHFRERAARRGHKYARPETCEDGVCQSYHESTS